MKLTKKIWLFALLFTFIMLLSACGGQTVAEAEAEAEAASAEVDPVAIFTSAAGTVAAQLTETAISFSPTPEPATATATLIPPTATLVDLNQTPLSSPTVVSLVEATSTLIPGLPTYTPGIPTLFPTATQQLLPTVEGPICDSMTYGTPVDTNYPDGSILQPGEDFQKIWRVYNAGVCTWDDGYSLVPVSSTSDPVRPGDNNPLDAVNPAWAITKTEDFVLPGEVKDIDVHLTAPLDPGVYSTCFILQNDRDVYFGGVLCVEIKVE